MYRLGANHQQLPINRANVAVNNYNQDGAMSLGSTNSDINYQSNRDEVVEDSRARRSQTKLTGYVQQAGIDKQKNFFQAGILYRSLSKQEKTNLIRNLTNDLSAVKDKAIKIKMVSHFYKADAEYGSRLSKSLKLNVKDVKKMAMKL